MRSTVFVISAVLLSTACSDNAPSGGAAVAPSTDVSAPVQDNTWQASGWSAKTLPELVAALEAGEVSAEALVEAYLARIDAVDRNGPTLQSVLSVNPDALEQARAVDASRAAGEPLGSLAGVPVLLKDNIESADSLATTAGALALKHNVTNRDAPLTAGLRREGAIILGKTNLSEWANFRSTHSISGWSALGGQVRNPHMLDRSPCGSSSGSGAAVAASLAAAAVGTETNGSITCPANVNGIVGFKPTVGVISQQYIVPISASQDTAGPMTKTVRGAAMLLEAMADEAHRKFYAAGLDAGSLVGRRVGVLRFSVGDNPDIAARFSEAMTVLADAGAELVEIGEFKRHSDNFWAQHLSLLQYEFKSGIDAYLVDAADAVTTRSLAALIEFNDAHADVEQALFDQDLFTASQAKAGLDSTDYLASRDAVQRTAREFGIDALLAEHNVEVLVAPSGPVSSRIDPVNGDVWPDWAGAGYLAAAAGYPHLTVPMGAVHGIPIGLSFMGAANDDAAILSYGYAYEQASQRRVEPQYLRTAEDLPEIADAMRAPAQGSLPRITR
ncbi:MAG: amidase [Pseudomonadota bacterium]